MGEEDTVGAVSAYTLEATEFERALILSQREAGEADEREAAEEWAIAFEAAEAAREVEAAVPPPAVPHEAECVVCMHAPPSHILTPDDGRSGRSCRLWLLACFLPFRDVRVLRVEMREWVRSSVWTHAVSICRVDDSRPDRSDHGSRQGRAKTHIFNHQKTGCIAIRVGVKHVNFLCPTNQHEARSVRR